MNFVKRLCHTIYSLVTACFRKAAGHPLLKKVLFILKSVYHHALASASLTYVPFTVSIIILLTIVMAAPIASLQTGKPESKNKNASIEGYRVYLDDRELGYVRDRDAFKEITRNLDQKYFWITRDTLFWNQVSFQKTTLENPSLFTGSIQERIKVYLEEHEKGWYIRVDKQNLVALESKEAALSVIETIFEEYTPKAGEEDAISIMEIGIVEHVEIFPAIVAKKDIVSETDALHYIKKGTHERRSYTVVQNDTIWDIGRKFGLSMSEIEEANPDINIERIYPGDVINLIVPKPFITIKSRYMHTYRQAIPYKIHIIWDDSLYRTEMVNVRPGRNGTEEITSQVTAVNGKIIRENIMSERTVHPPQTGILRRGTQRTPDDILVSSVFLPPGKGLISSYFGPRWGAFHYGIDVAVPVGTPVHAFESGRVVFTGFLGRFGRTVIIEHPGGIISKYGHLNKILVEVDQYVAEATLIAYSGNSGFSTGPHVHFEIRENNRPIDPLPFLKANR